MAVQLPADAEAPLDPAVERVQRRLRRLLLISGLTLGLGLCAVFAAILYRLDAAGDKSPISDAPVREASAALPAGARLVSATSDGGRIVLVYEHEGATTVMLIDARTLGITGRLELKPQ